MNSSSHKLIAIVLSVLVMLLPLQSTMANFTGTSSEAAVTHEMMMEASSDVASNASSGMSEDCQHCKSGQCDTGSVCNTGVCYSTMAAMLTSSFLIPTGHNIIFPTDSSHLVSIAPTSLFRPPRH